MKITLWQKKDTVIYVGGNPNHGEPPLISIDVHEPQILIDESENCIVIKETK